MSAIETLKQKYSEIIGKDEGTKITKSKNEINEPKTLGEGTKNGEISPTKGEGILPNPNFLKKIAPSYALFTNVGLSSFLNATKIDQKGIQDTIKQMYYGGEKILGLQKIGTWKINPDYHLQNIRQQSGYVAEIIGVARENIAAKVKGTNIETFRVTDLPEKLRKLYNISKYDQHVDIVRVKNGKIIETSQIKHLGDNAIHYIRKFAEPKYFEKYFTGKVDKVEIPSDVFPKFKDLLPKEIKRLQEQIKHLEKHGKTEIASKLRDRIARLEQVQKIVKSHNVSYGEAIFARLNIKKYVSQFFNNKVVPEVVKKAGKDGLLGAGIIGGVELVKVIPKLMNGSMSPVEALTEVSKKATEGAISFGGGRIISEGITFAMEKSSHQLIKNLVKNAFPSFMAGGIIYFGISSFDSVIDYTQGKIDGITLAHKLGSNGAEAAGMVIGGTVGTMVGGPVGGFIGGTVGSLLAGQAYKTMIEIGKSEEAQIYAENAKALALSTIEQAKALENGTDVSSKVIAMRNSFNEYFTENKIPVSV